MISQYLIFSLSSPSMTDILPEPQHRQRRKRSRSPSCSSGHEHASPAHQQEETLPSPIRGKRPRLQPPPASSPDESSSSSDDSLVFSVSLSQQQQDHSGPTIYREETLLAYHDIRLVSADSETMGRLRVIECGTHSLLVTHLHPDVVEPMGPVHPDDDGRPFFLPYDLTTPINVNDEWHTADRAGLSKLWQRWNHVVTPPPLHLLCWISELRRCNGTLPEEIDMDAARDRLPL